MTQTRQAIVNEEAGTTRDRQYGKAEWTGKEFSLIDTGGWVINSDDVFEEEIRKQVLLAVDEADVILFVVDVMNGVTDLDMQVAAILRRANSPVIMVANKTDNHDLQYNAPEFYKLGLGDPYCVSAMTGSGTGDLMDLIVSNFKKESSEILDDDIPRFAVVGRPNAGKAPTAGYSESGTGTSGRHSAGSARAAGRIPLRPPPAGRNRSPSNRKRRSARSPPDLSLIHI